MWQHGRNDPSVSLVIVEIDEMKFDRRKYERGRVMEGSWIFGAIDIATGALRLEICLQNKRDRETLIPIIKKHIKAGSKIYLDCWKAHDCLGQEGYLSVNHSIEFVNVKTGAIESQWRPLRLQRGGVRSENLDCDHLCEYLWRHEAKRNNLDLFVELIRSIRIIYPGVN